MTPRELRKKALKLRTRALGEPNAQMQANYRAMANVYDALARMLEICSADASVKAAGRDLLLIPPPQSGDGPRARR